MAIPNFQREIDLGDGVGFDLGRLRAIVRGEARMSREEALDLYYRAPLHELGRWADARCRVVHGERIRTYVIDRNINYTNVCSAHCTFCAFRRNGDDNDAYTLSYEAILDKIRELVEIGGTQILMQGGMNPELPLSWYEELLHRIKDEFPGVHIHAFSPPEFIEFVHFFDPPGGDLEAKLEWVFRRLQAAGLDSLPGGGGEIFAEPVRRKIGLGKCTAEAWLTVMRVAHKLGMYTSATMMFGHIEGIADRIDHLDRVRNWQDRAIADFGTSGGGRYKAFIAWPFQRENTPLGRLPEWNRESGDEFPGDAVARGVDHPRFGKSVRMAGATEYLRTQAISRLYLDNIYSIGSSWVTMGPHIGQLALQFGANDMGSVMMEENVVSAAGTTYCLTEPLICRLIRDAGFLPAQRDNVYNLLRVHDTDDAPDRAVGDWSTQRARKLAVEARPDGLDGGGPVTVTVGASDS
ncbi:MAG: radical SAM protein [Phycisphaerales bacterium]